MMVLVTGSTGFVGRSVMHVLEDYPTPVKVYTGRINSPQSLREALVGVDSIVHLAGAETWDRVRLLEHVDVEGTERLLEESEHAGVGHIVLLSRLNADPNSVHALLRAKGEQERLLRHSGIPYTILRSATLFGRDDRFLNVIAGMAVWTWPVIWLPGDGQVAMQPLWVEDLARCLVACLDRPDLLDQVIEVAGEERLHYAEIARQVLISARMRRITFGVSIKVVRPLSALLFGWWPRAPVTRFFMDRFSVPEVAPVDSVWSHFGFRPGLMGQHSTYLRRPGQRWRFFGLGRSR